MRSFLRKIAALVLLHAVVGGLLWWRYQRDDNSYAASTLDKHALLQAPSKPRVLLVGGSNAALGLSAEQLSSALKRPAINMGVHANLGRDFMLAEVQHSLRAGDVVVLSFEYQLFGADPAPNTQMQVIEARPESRAFVSAGGFRRILDDGLILIGERARRALLPRPAAIAPYSRDSFNDYGDAVGHHSLPSRRPLLPFYFERLSEDNIARGRDAIERFVRHAKTRGVQVAYVYPPLPATLAAQYADEIARIAAAVATIGELNVFNEPQVFPGACFFDTAYHLTRECAQLRSTELMQPLQRILAVPRSSRGGATG